MIGYVGDDDDGRSSYGYGSMYLWLAAAARHRVVMVDRNKKKILTIFIYRTSYDRS